MINRVKIILLAFILTGFLGFSNEFQNKQNLKGAIQTWDKFVGALRIGDMPDAYSKLSEESKSILSYRDFCVEWHPIGIKYNTVLSNPGYSNFSIYGDIATIKIGLDPSLNNTESNFIRIILEKNGEKWSFVCEKAHDQAIRRASITGVLKDIIKESKILNTAFKTGKGSFDNIVEELPRIFSSDRGRLALINYNFELDLLRDGVLRAIPRKKYDPGYQISYDGVLSTFTSTPKDIITAEELEAKRKKEKESNQTYPKEELKHKVLVARKFSDKLENRVKKEESKKIAFSPKNDLPDLPPEFPKEFNRVKKSSHKNSNNKKFKYTSNEEDFDLPEIDNITELFDSKKSINSKPKSVATQTMAGTNNELDSNSVNLNSETLLNELELMVNEYEKNDNFSITGRRDD